jgi:membrane associated rhomboid family serine protease
MLETFTAQLTDLLNTSHSNLFFSFALLAFLWGVHIVNALLRYHLNLFGIYPRSIFGLIGIPFSPFLHGSFEHLFFNSIPFFILTNLVLLKGRYAFLGISTSIIFIQGILIWLFARKGLHVGASALIMGYWSYLIVNIRDNTVPMQILLAFVCLYYLGGLFTQLFPSEEGVSFEGHIAGFLAGIITALGLPIFIGFFLS